MPPFLAGLLWLFDRWQQQRGATFASGLPMRFGWLVALSYIGAITHPLLDLQNTYAVQLLSPLSDAWFHNDALFIIDVWVWTALAFAIWLSRRREARRRALAAPCAGRAGGGGDLHLAQRRGWRAGPARPRRAGADEGCRRHLRRAPAIPVLEARAHLAGQWPHRSRRLRPRVGHSERRAGNPRPDGRPAGPPRASRQSRRDRFPALVGAANRECCTNRLPRANVSFGDARFGHPRVSARFVQSVDLPLPGPGCRPALAIAR